MVSAVFFAFEPAITDLRSLATSAVLRRAAVFAAGFFAADFFGALVDLTAIAFLVFRLFVGARPAPFQKGL